MTQDRRAYLLVESTAVDDNPGEPHVETWRQIIVGEGKSRVLFAHGTCVILMEPEEDLTAHAMDLMRQWGPVHVGSPGI